jgi:hypothetical protein
MRPQRRGFAVGEKRKKVYQSLVDGATKGLSDKQLYDYVVKKCPKVSSKRIVRSSLLALSDPDVKDANILHTIYALAIKHRLDDIGSDEDHEEDDAAEELTSKKTVRKSGAAPSPVH